MKQIQFAYLEYLRIIDLQEVYTWICLFDAWNKLQKYSPQIVV